MDTPFFDVEKFTVPKAGMAAFQSQLVLLTENSLAVQDHVQMNTEYIYCDDW